MDSPMTGFSHVQLLVTDVRTSEHWYATVLGLERFAADDGDVLEEWAAHLTRVGIDHRGVVLDLGKPSLQLRDPDGNAVELVAPAP
jgi:catechol-2,3-dioxygenase